VWYGDSSGTDVSPSGSVLNNRFTGAFGYAIAVATAQNFTVQGNTLFENTSFITSTGPDCNASETIPTSAPFIVDPSNVTNTTLQSDFQAVQNCKRVTCVVPPNGGNNWPYGSYPSLGNDKRTSPSAHGSKSRGLTVGLAVGTAVIVVIAIIILVRRYGKPRIRETPPEDKMTPASPADETGSAHWHNPHPNRHRKLRNYLHTRQDEVIVPEPDHDSSNSQDDVSADNHNNEECDDRQEDIDDNQSSAYSRKTMTKRSHSTLSLVSTARSRVSSFFS